MFLLNQGYEPKQTPQVYFHYCFEHHKMGENIQNNIRFFCGVGLRAGV